MDIPSPQQAATATPSGAQPCESAAPARTADQLAAEARLATERHSQQLVRYEALFTLLDEMRALDDLGAVAQLVTTRWKYLASVSAWRLTMAHEALCMVLEGSRGKGTVSTQAEASPWEAFHRAQKRPSLVDPQNLQDSPAAPGGLGAASVTQLLVLPIHQGDTCVALLTVATKDEALGEMDQKFVRLFGEHLADHVSLVLMRQREMDRLRSMVTRDALTGALNRGGIMDMLNSQLALSRRTGQPLSLVIADADHFKRVNDTYGHPAGDEVLRELSRRFSSLTRLGEHFGRYGGEEFVFVLFPCNGEQALLAAERIRRGIAERPFVIDTRTGQELPVTISMGACSSGQLLMPSAEELIKHADEALYAAKAGGRNAVRLADIPVQTEAEALGLAEPAADQSVPKAA